MSQEVKIGVQANTTAAETAVKNLDRSAEGAAQSVGDISSAAKEAITNLSRMEEVARRLKSTQDILSRELGRSIGPADAQTALNNFDKMRTGRGVGRRMLRGFNTFEDWYQGHGTAYRRQQDAEAHRRFVLAQSMQGTSDARDNGAPPPPGDDGGEGGRPAPPASFGSGMRKASSSALGFGKSMLALAGINSVMAMAGQAVDYATEESTGTDTLKRRMGDLGVDFDRLRDQARGAATGLGITYVESSRLAQQFSSTAGNLNSRDLEGGGLQHSLRTAYGFSRAFGVDPSQGVQFFGTMRRLGIGGDDQSNRKLALTIADSIEKGGYGGKADEVLAAIADFSSQVSRITLGAPNVTAFAGAMSSLTGMGYAGLDPAAAAAILGQADASVRRGGAYGQASMNFSYASLYRAMPGLDPVSAQGIMAGGLFGSAASQFGPKTPLGDFYRANHIGLPALSSKTNFELQMGLLRKNYGNTPWLLDAMKNQFGLQSIQQSAVLANMNPGSLHDMVGMLGHAGLNLGDIKESAYKGLAAIANAGPGDLQKIYASTRQRKDISDKERAALDEAAKANPQALKDALVRVVGTHEQVETDGSKTRDSITEMKNELTKVGAALLQPLNLIRQGVVAVAEHFGYDGFKNPVLTPSNIGADYVKGFSQRDLDRVNGLVKNNHGYDRLFAEAAKKYGVSADDLKLIGSVESGLRQVSGPKTRYGQAYGIMQVMPDKAHPLNALQDIRTNIMAGGERWADALRRAHGDKATAFALYYAGLPKNIGPNSTQYAANMALADHYVNGHPYHQLPQGDPEAKSGGGSDPVVKVHITADDIRLWDTQGNLRGQAPLKASGGPVPAGAKR